MVLLFLPHQHRQAPVFLLACSHQLLHQLLHQHPQVPVLVVHQVLVQDCPTRLPLHQLLHQDGHPSPHQWHQLVTIPCLGLRLYQLFLQLELLPQKSQSPHHQPQLHLRSHQHPQVTVQVVHQVLVQDCPTRLPLKFLAIVPAPYQVLFRVVTLPAPHLRTALVIQL